MKLNNKGFAITAVIYGILILFVYFVSFYLLALSAKKNTLDNIIEDIENDIPEEIPGVTIDGTLAQYISNLYSAAGKIEVENNSINYNYATSVSLMNDRLGGTTSSLDGGNIRYYGVSPNNYLYFNCNDYDNQSSSTCEVWRIIGVFDGKVKIIRNESIGNYAWDSSGTNDWNNASLKTYLNGDYYNDMQDDTKNMIETVTWNLGGYGPDNSTGIIYTGANLYSNDAYIAENSTSVYTGNSSTWDGKIALLDNSDYGYAANFETCTLHFFDYYNDGCYNNDWLYINTAESGGTMLGGTQWSLTHVTNNSSKIWVIFMSFRADNPSSSSFTVRPTLYLNENTLYVDGDGTSGNPYQIKLNS